MQNFKVEVIRDGEKLVPDENGFLGRFTEGAFTLMVEISRDLQGLAFTLSGRKEPKQGHRVSVSKDRQDDPGQPRIYTRRVVIDEGNNGLQAVTQSGENNIRVLSWMGEHFELWAVSIVAQNGNFFLVVEPQQAEFCCRSNLLFSKIDNDWSRLADMIRAQIASGAFTFSMRSSKIAPEFRQETYTDESFPKGEGRIEWWSGHLQAGLACVGDNAGHLAWVHFSDVRFGSVHGDTPVRRTLSAGQRIRFGRMQPYDHGNLVGALKQVEPISDAAVVQRRVAPKKVAAVG